MPLTLRERFQLKVSLASRYDQPTDAKRIAKAASINTLNISFNGKPIELWEQIIDEAERRNRLIGLVQTVCNENADDLNCKLWLDELTNGVPTRVQKLAQSIANGNCLLFLGPGTLLCNVPPDDDPDGTPVLTVFNQAFARSLAREMRDSTVYFDEKSANNLAYIAQRYNDVQLPDMDRYVRDLPGMQGKLAQEFYDTCRPDTRLYELLAELPFRVIINTNADNELAAILNNKAAGSPDSPQPRCVHRYYSLANAQDGLPPAGPRPLEPGQSLLYNIFGSFSDRPSMILTESQLLDFTNRILNRNPPLDLEVMAEFTTGEDVPKSYLFLGFDFDQWYVKIMFQTVLKLTKQKDRTFSIFPKGLDYKQFNREFFEEEFKCYFIDDDLALFLKSIVAEYQKLLPKL